jgi:outer membrane immunogenic protein
LPAECRDTWEKHRRISVKNEVIVAFLAQTRCLRFFTLHAVTADGDNWSMRLFRDILLAGSVAFTSTAGFAADLPSRLPPVYPPPLPIFTWTGFYVGVNAGGAWNAGNDLRGSDNVAAVVPANNVVHFPIQRSDSAGATVGGLAGYNYQVNRAVFGVETDFNYADVESKLAGTLNTATAQFTNSYRSQVDWFGTLRARLGFLPTDRLLIYGTGGLAYGEVDTRITVVNNFSNGFTANWRGDNSPTNIGWTAGGGIEYALTNNVTLRAEYLYVDLGKSSAVAHFQGTNDPTRSQIVYGASNETKFNVARVAVSYKF